MSHQLGAVQSLTLSQSAGAPVHTVALRLCPVSQIFTYVIEGHITHRDSMGHKEALGPGSVQYLSAGTGITHSVSVVCDGPF